MRHTPATLLGINAAKASPDDFDKAVETKARDPSRQWQLDVLGRVCADYLVVSDCLTVAYYHYVLRSTHRELMFSASVGDMKSSCVLFACRSSISRSVKQFLVSQ